MTLLATSIRVQKAHAMPLQLNPAKELDEALFDLRLPLAKSYVCITRELVSKGHHILIPPEVLAHFAFDICPDALPWLPLDTLVLSLLRYRAPCRFDSFADCALAHLVVGQRYVNRPMSCHPFNHP